MPRLQRDSNKQRFPSVRKTKGRNLPRAARARQFRRFLRSDYRPPEGGNWPMRKAFPAIAELNRLDNIYFKGPNFAKLVKKILASVGEEKAIEFIKGHTKVYADAWLGGINNGLLDLKYPINPRDEHKGKGWTNAERNRLVKDPFQWFLNTCADYPNAREEIIAQGYYLTVCKLAEKEAIALRKNFKENALAWLKARGIPMDSEEIERDIRGFDRTFRQEYMASPEKTLRIYENLTVQSMSTKRGQLQSRRQKANRIALEAAKRMGLNPVKPEDRRIIKIVSAALFDFTPEKEYSASKSLEMLKRRYKNIVSGLSETERHAIERNMEGKIREALKIEAPPAPEKNAPSPYLVLAKLKDADLHVIDMTGSSEFNEVLKEIERGNDNLRIRAERIIRRELKSRGAAQAEFEMQKMPAKAVPAQPKPRLTRGQRREIKGVRHAEAQEERRKSDQERARFWVEELRAGEKQAASERPSGTVSQFEAEMRDLRGKAGDVASLLERLEQNGMSRERTSKLLSKTLLSRRVQNAISTALSGGFEKRFSREACATLINIAGHMESRSGLIDASEFNSKMGELCKDKQLRQGIAKFLFDQHIVEWHSPSKPGAEPRIRLVPKA
jgi:hypothetical protein